MNKPRPLPREIPVWFRRGCRFVALGLLAVTAIAVGSFVYLLIIAEPADGPVSAVSFRNCSPAQEAYLTSVHQALVDNNRMLDDFDGLRAISNSAELELKMALQRPWPMELTCVGVDVAPCTHGIAPPGTIGLFEAAIELDVCDYTRPEADFCDTFATLAYGHALARRVVRERAERYHDFIKSECVALDL